MNKRNPNNQFFLMLALGLCLGVVIVSINDADQTFRNGRLVSFKDLSLEFSSNGNTADSQKSDSVRDLDLISTLNAISRFIGAADSISSDDLTSVDSCGYSLGYDSELLTAKPSASTLQADCGGTLSAKISIVNFARASI